MLSSPQLPGWCLSMWDFQSSDGPFTIRLGGRWGDVSNDLAPYGGANNSVLANRLMHPLADFAVRFAVDSLLSTLERHLAGIRDRVAQAGNYRNRVRHDDVAELYDLVTDAGYDARVVAAELADFCGDTRRYGHAEVDFAPVADWRREHEPSLLEVLRSADEARAANVIAAEAIARDSVANLASVMTSKVNLRLGRIVLWLTWVTVATGFWHWSFRSWP